MKYTWGEVSDVHVCACWDEARTHDLVVTKMYLYSDSRTHSPRVFLLAAAAVADVDFSSATSASLRAPSSSSSCRTSRVFRFTSSIVRPTGDVAGAVPTPALPEAPSSEVPEVELVTEEAKKLGWRWHRRGCLHAHSLRLPAPV